MLFLVHMLQAFSFWTVVTFLSSSLLVIIKGFVKENTNNESCSWGVIDLVLESGLIFIDGIWSIESRVRRVRKLVSEGYYDIIGDL